MVGSGVFEGIFLVVFSAETQREWSAVVAAEGKSVEVEIEGVLESPFFCLMPFMPGDHGSNNNNNVINEWCGSIV